MHTDDLVPRDALETWAGILLDHSLGGIGPTDRVMIKGERACWPLLEVLERKVVEAGAWPDVWVVPPNNERGRVWSAAMMRGASPDKVAQTPDWLLARYQSMTRFIEVMGAENPASYAGLTPDQVGRLAAAERPFANIRLSKPWVLTLFPTPGFAAMEGLSLEEYARILVAASTTDPRPLRDAEAVIGDLLEKGRTMRIETRCPHTGRDLVLSLDIAEGLPRLSYGLRNFPDGEVFTSPSASATEGEIYLDLPVHYGGEDLQGIWFRFEKGRIVEFDARQGRQRVGAILDTDAGARRLGEVAFGMNPGLERVFKHPLLVEKVGGTMHIAVGAAFDECFVRDPGSEAGRARLAALEEAGVFNRSAQHIDLVVDFRPGGAGRRAFIDDREMVVRDGIWVPA